MNRTRLADRELPAYSRSEETGNMVSHIVGAALGVVALVWCLALAQGAMQVFTSILYAGTMILLYTASSIYHGLPDSIAKRVFQVLDHCTIYLFIASTYTIIMLVAVRPENAFIAWLVTGIEWVAVAVAVTLTAIDLERFRHFSLTCYIVMGWAGVIAVVPGLRALGWAGGSLVVAGGISYTIGSVLYVIGRKNQREYAHFVFHLFTLLGTLLQFLCIIFYVLG